MPFIENDGVKICYEVEGEGAPLMLHHGLSATRQLFHDYKYTEPLSQKYKLILIDARGHGKSDKPHTPESYTHETLVSDTVSILNKLEIEKSHFMGYSFGGRVGLAIAKYAPDRFSSLIIGGAGAIERDSEEEIKKNLTTISRFREGSEGFIRVAVEAGIAESEARVRASSTDWEAMIAILSNQEHLGFEEFLPSLKMPCLFFMGEDDYRHSSAKRTAEMIENARFVSLPGLDHAQAIRKYKRVLPHLLRFLADQSNS